MRFSKNRRQLQQAPSPESEPAAGANGALGTVDREAGRAQAEHAGLGTRDQVGRFLEAERALSRRARRKRYEGHTRMESVERWAFLTVFVLSALLGMALAVVGGHTHNWLLHPVGPLGLTLISGGSAVRLEFLRRSSSDS